MASEEGYSLATSLYLRQWARWNPTDAAAFLQNIEQQQRAKIVRLLVSEEYRQLAPVEFLDSLKQEDAQR